MINVFCTLARDFFETENYPFPLLCNKLFPSPFYRPFKIMATRTHSAAFNPLFILKRSLTLKVLLLQIESNAPMNTIDCQ